MNLKVKNILFLFFAIFILGSGGINSSLMFKTPKGGSFKYDSIPMKPSEEYHITKDDKFNFYLYPNSGEKLIESISGTSVNGENQLYNNNNSVIFIRSFLFFFRCI